jgi:hypothetical protein
LASRGTAFLHAALHVGLVGCALALASAPALREAGATAAPLVVLATWLLWLVALGGARDLGLAPSLRRNLIIVFALRVVAGICFALWWHSYAADLPMVDRGGDAFRQDVWGWEIAQAAERGEWNDLLAGRLGSQRIPFEQPGIVYLQGLFYYFVGRNPSLVGLVGVLVGALIALETYRIGRIAFGEAVARRAMVFVAFLPEILAYSVVGYKDSLVTYLVLVTCRLAASGGGARVAAFTALPLALLSVLRVQSVLFVLVFAVGLAVLRREQRGRLFRAAVASASLIGLVALLVGGTADIPGVGLLNSIGHTFSPERDVLDSILEGDIGASFSGKPTDSMAIRTYWNHDLSRAYLLLPRTLLIMMIPFPPTQFGDPLTALSSASSWLVILSFPFLARGAIAILRGRRETPERLCLALLPLAIGLLGVAMTDPFFSIRHRQVVMPFVAIVAAFGFTLHGRKVEAVSVMVAAAMCGVVMYAVIKA